MIKTLDLVALSIENIRSKNDFFYYKEIKFKINETNDFYEMWAIDEINIVNLIYFINLAKSKSEAKRLIKSGAVEIDGKKYTDYNINFEANFLNNKILKVGRNFRKLKCN